MMKRIVVAGLMLGMFLGARQSFAAPVAKAVQKPIKVVIKAIRYKKDALASKQISFPHMAKLMAGDAGWTKFSEAQRTELIAGLEVLISSITFDKGRDLFKYLDNVVYDEPREEGGLTLCKTTVTVHHKLKKTEIVIDFVLVKDGEKYKIVDTIMLGQSTAEGVREDQIEPMLEEGGSEAVMDALRVQLKKHKK